MKKVWILLTVLLVLTGAVVMFTTSAADSPTEAQQATESAPAIAQYPEIVSITPDYAGFIVKWTEYPGAAKYRLFVRGAAGWNRVGDTADTTLRHHTLEDQKTYTYTVRALDADGKYMSTYLVAGWSSIFRSAPKLTSVAPVGNALKITWNPVPDAECYRVFRKEGSAWVSIGYSDDNTFTDQQVVSGNTYSYTVRGYDAARTTALSAFQSPGMSATFVSMPVISGIEAKNTGVRISWEKAPGAVKYRVFIKASNGWKRVGDTSSLYYDYASAPYDTESVYTVRALNAAGGYLSDFYRDGGRHTRLRIPRLVSLTNLYGGQRLTWEPVDGAAVYRIYLKSGSAWKKFADTTASGYLIQNLKNAATYTFTVRCLSADGRSFQSGFSSGISTRYLDTPIITKADNLKSGARIAWDKVDGVPKYRVFVKNGASWKRLGDTDGTTFTHTAVEQGVTYTYTVRGVDARGNFVSGFVSTGFDNRYQTAPLLGGVEPCEDGALLTWEPYEGVENYRVYRRNIGVSGWTRIGDAHGDSFVDTEVPAGIPCQYTLRCIDEEGNLISDYIAETPYWCDSVRADGKINVNGYQVTFKNGVITKGYVTAQDIIKIARAEVGTKATNYKRCKYNTWYYGADVSGDCYDWCVVFVEWVFEQAGARSLLFDNTAGAEFFGLGFYHHGQLVRSNYRVGDLVLLHWTDGYSDYVPGYKKLNHVGIVIAVNSDGSVTTIEGNTGSSINGEVMIKTRYPEIISCACRPKYGFYIPAE